MSPILRSLVAVLPLIAAAPLRAQMLSEPATCEQPDYQMQAPALTADDRLSITADRGLFEQNGLSNLAGAVKLQQGDKEFSASALSYDDVQKQVHIRVESLFRNRSFIIKSREAMFDLGKEQGEFTGTEFTLPERAARGVADKVTLTSSGNAEIDGVGYTTCSPGARGWLLQASHIDLDHDEGLGTARHAKLRFGGVPILYMPYFQFPLDSRRRTGLLFPTVGQSNKTGFDLRQPVYLNLAPNYDAVLTPRLMTTRGLQLGSGGRYLFSRGEGKATFDYLSQDKATGDTRSYFQTDNVGLVNQRLGYAVHVARASDRNYFEDLGVQGDIASITHLERNARLTYQAPAAYTIVAMAQDYQTISSSVPLADEPYARLPQVRVRARTKNTKFNTRLSFGGEYVNFVRSQSLEGQRVDLTPTLRMEREETAWYYAAQADYRYTAYQLTGVGAGQPADPRRSLPQFSSEGGLRFDRVTGGGRLQTLEPYVFYLYTPFREQNQLPLFDTGLPDFDYTQLFARNRFSGEDRISDANQFAVAARSRLLEPDSGDVKLAASVGQLFRVQPSRVLVPGASAPDAGPTDFFADFDYHLSQRWTSQLASDWSPDEKRFQRIGVALHYRDSSRRFDVSYRYRRNILEQADVTASLPVGSSWRVALRSRYSLRDSSPLDNLAGVEFETCCYAIRSSYRRFVANTAGEYNSGVYLQLELKGLTRIGAGFDGLLPLDETLETRQSRY